MNTVRILAKGASHITLELHGSGMVPVYEYDANDKHDLIAMVQNAAEWCARTPEKFADETKEAERAFNRAFGLHA